MNQPNYNETIFDVLVPAGANTYGIDPKSAIVAGASQRGQERMRVYYEGNRLGACNLVDFIGRCRSAAGRSALRYPTIAFGVFPPEDFVCVGVYDLAAHRFTEIHDADRLAEWAGETVRV